MRATEFITEAPLTDYVPLNFDDSVIASQVGKVFVM